MTQPIDVSNLLPPEDRDKPNDANWDPNKGDDVEGGSSAAAEDKTENLEFGGVTYGPDGKKLEDSKPAEETKPEDKKPEEKPEDKKEAAPTDEKKEGAEDQAKEGEKAEKTDSAAAPADGEKKPEEEKKDEDNVPFHKHPDWIKMQEQLESANKKLDEYATKDAESKKVVVNAKEFAKTKVQEKINTGWEPKDAIEAAEVYGEFLVEGLAAERKQQEETAAEDTKKYNDARDAAKKAVDDTFADLKITDAGEQDKVSDLANKWIEEGSAKPTVATLKLAAEHLKLKGEILKPAEEKKPEIKKVDGQDEEIKKDLADKNETNKIVEKPKSDGEKKDEKVVRNYSEERHKDLDQIVAEQGAKLG